MQEYGRHSEQRWKPRPGNEIVGLLDVERKHPEVAIILSPSPGPRAECTILEHVDNVRFPMA
jgi:hypothetical protein